MTQFEEVEFQRKLSHMSDIELYRFWNSMTFDEKDFYPKNSKCLHEMAFRFITNIKQN